MWLVLRQIQTSFTWHFFFGVPGTFTVELTQFSSMLIGYYCREAKYCLALHSMLRLATMSYSLIRQHQIDEQHMERQSIRSDAFSSVTRKAWALLSFFVQAVHTPIVSHSQFDKHLIMPPIYWRHPLCVAVMPPKKIHAFCGQWPLCPWAEYNN
jgi:hypothetical protein